MKSYIKELLKDKECILVFDVDGVLAIAEWGKYNHFIGSNDEWNKICNEGRNFYTENNVSKKMQDFLKSKDMNKIYILTTTGTENEKEFKKEYLKKYYNIKENNFYYVEKNEQKATEIQKIKALYPKLEDYKIVMIDDNTDILTDIMVKTNFSTVHISSFLDI